MKNIKMALLSVSLMSMVLFGACSQAFVIGISESDEKGKYLISGYEKGFGGVTPKVWEADSKTLQTKELEIVEK